MAFQADKHEIVNLISSSPDRAPIASSFSNPTTPREAPRPPPRLAKPLPYQLQEHCTIYFEEGLYTQALIFLSSLVSSGAASLHGSQSALVPTPAILRLINTLIVHPSLTIRAKTSDHLQASNLALRYLYLVLHNVGPLQSHFTEAFAFPGLMQRSHGRRRVNDDRPRGTRPGAARANDANAIENGLANSASLFVQTETFWQVVGWAFNCSVRHPKRWERWSLWLEFMIMILWTEWVARSEEERQDSLIVQYIMASGAPNDCGRRLLRAIFADGKNTSLGEFPEVWRNETKELKVNEDGEPVKKRDEGGIDMEADDYGDYISSSNDESSSLQEGTETAAVQDATGATDMKSSRPPSSPLGGHLALQLRYRLLSLCSTVCHFVPSTFSYHFASLSSKESNHQTISVYQRGEITASFYTQIISHLRPFPITTFHLLFSPSTLLSEFDPDAASVLIQVLLHRCALLETSAPEPESYMLTQETLLENFLPWGANASGRVGEQGKGADEIRGKSARGLVAQAKVSICVETLLRLLDSVGGGLEWNEELAKAVEAGIKRREKDGPPQRAGKTSVSLKGGGKKAKVMAPARGGGKGSTTRRSGHRNNRNAKYEGIEDQEDEEDEEEEEERAWQYLRQSGERMRILVQLTKLGSDGGEGEAMANADLAPTSSELSSIPSRSSPLEM